MVVSLIWQIGPPQEMYPHPFADPEQGIEQGDPLCSIERAAREQAFTRQNIFIRGEERRRKDGLKFPP
jgi:hypothetical protein